MLLLIVCHSDMSVCLVCWGQSGKCFMQYMSLAVVGEALGAGLGVAVQRCPLDPPTVQCLLPQLAELGDDEPSYLYAIRCQTDVWCVVHGKEERRELEIDYS